ncbi:hypothetical protein [Streptomyces himalayensis]|uniref:Uncharacterized protein n=1 Tax=Streptomyces himalayensis subsp. himalayensis TaxID=2756131 RepID=A0A7W0I6I1_9ACTN|nr:hypothetical protein [Streptomyces himalayensis]MBA2944330.1 hypothetical protein [Streptomyces himalayensis subsp. himalayensis]
MVEVEELLDETVLRMPSGAEVRARATRRRTRRRVAVAAAVTAVVVGAASWAVLPGGGPADVRPAGTPTASPSADAGDTPYKKDGVVRLLTGEQVPLDEKWHWRRDEQGNIDAPLPYLFFDGCPDSLAYSEGHGNQQRYTTSFNGDDEALARQRYAEYDNAADAAADLTDLRESLSACGLKQHGRGEDSYYADIDTDGRGMRVTIEHGERWTSVVEVQEGWPQTG